jgi:hypothetical protein
MAMPDPMDWEDIYAFRVSGARQIAHDDLDLGDHQKELGKLSASRCLSHRGARPWVKRFQLCGNAE